MCVSVDGDDRGSITSKVKGVSAISTFMVDRICTPERTHAPTPTHNKQKLSRTHPPQLSFMAATCAFVCVCVCVSAT